MAITDAEREKLRVELEEEQEKKEITYPLADGQKITLSTAKVKRFLTRGNGTLTDVEAMMFLQLCKFKKLNPFLNDAYLVKFSDKYDASTVVSKEYFVKTARKNQNFEGFEAGVIVKSKENGEITEREGSIAYDDESLIGGWCKSYISTKKFPSVAKVSMKEYIGKKGGGEVNSQWAKMPATMIRKVAIVQSLRELFPEDFNGLYDESEVNESTAIKKKGYIDGEVVEDEKTPEQKSITQIDKMKEILKKNKMGVEKEQIPLETPEETPETPEQQQIPVEELEV